MIGEAFDSLHPLPPSPTPLQPSHKGRRWFPSVEARWVFAKEGSSPSSGHPSRPSETAPQPPPPPPPQKRTAQQKNLRGRESVPTTVRPGP